MPNNSHLKILYIFPPPCRTVVRWKFTVCSGGSLCLQALKKSSFSSYKNHNKQICFAICLQSYLSCDISWFAWPYMDFSSCDGSKHRQSAVEFVPWRALYPAARPVSLIIIVYLIVSSISNTPSSTCVTGEEVWVLFSAAGAENVDGCVRKTVWCKPTPPVSPNRLLLRYPTEKG